MQDDCIFCKIGRGEIPAAILYEDEEFLAFRDINSQAPVHALVIPRAHVPTLMDAEDPHFLGRALSVARTIARTEKLDQTGFRVVINHRDDGGQTVYHLHIHVLGGRFMSWPPG